MIVSNSKKKQYMLCDLNHYLKPMVIQAKCLLVPCKSSEKNISDMSDTTYKLSNDELKK